MVLSSLRDFGFVEWWKAVAVVLTGIFALIALLKDNKDKRGQLTKWGMLAISGIVISSVGGLLAQIVESSNDAIEAKRRHEESISLLADQARLLRPLRVDKVYGEYRVPCSDAAYAQFCNGARGFRNAHPNDMMPLNLFDTFPGGRGSVVITSFRFFASEDEAKAQLTAPDDQRSKYSIYMQLPLIAWTDNKCGLRIGVFPPNSDVRLFIYESCPFIGINNFGGLQSHLDLDGLEFSTVATLNVPAPSLEPLSIIFVYGDAERDTINDLSRVQENGQTIYVGKFAGHGRANLLGEAR
jgi:hypothetical protein